VHSFGILHEIWRALEREEVELEKRGKLLRIGTHSKAKGRHKIRGREYNQQRAIQYGFLVRLYNRKGHRNRGGRTVDF
jgi:hypothetical protein